MNDGLLSEGVSFRGYVILRKIGAGGTGEVYLARHETLGINYAVKVVERRLVEGDREMLQRFSREVKTAARIRHPALVAVHDAGFDEAAELYFIVMDYMPGGTVADELRRAKRLSIKRALRIVRTVADGLRALERNGIVHRDVKPGNMLLSDDGLVRLSDMGIVREMAQGARTITQTGFALGTPAYMSYEQIVDSHAVDVRTDIYALGVSLYEMLTGKLPDGELSSVQLLKKRVDGARIPDIRTVNAAIPDWLAELVSRMTEPDAHVRLRSLDELIATIDSRLNEMAPKKNVFVHRKGRSTECVRFLIAGVLIGFLSLAVLVAIVFDREIGRRIVATGDEPQAVRPEDPIIPVGFDEPTGPTVRSHEDGRTVVREVTNEIVRIVTVTNVVMQQRVAETDVAAMEVSGSAVAESSESEARMSMTNVVEGVEIRGTMNESGEIRCLKEMLSTIADEVRQAHGLPKGRQVQSRVTAVELVPGKARYAFDATTGVVRVGAGYGGFPFGRAKMADMCVGFMASYSEGVSDPFNAQLNALIKARARQKAIGIDRPPQLRDRSVTMDLLQLECSRKPQFLPSYFRVRRDAYAKGKIVGWMSIHDFAAIVSLASGESVFPYLRRKGVKVDEFATNLKVRGLPKAAFFGE